jgi:Skp family chaperone for outer membrane proteins
LAGGQAVAYVSAQRILAEANDAKAEVAKVQTLQQQKSAELRAKQQALDTLRQQLAQATDVSVRVELQQQELQQRTDLDRASAQAQADLQALQRQAQNEVQVRVKSVLNDLSKGEKFQIVLNSDTAIVWAAPGVDLTTAVIERLNRGDASSAPKH